MWIDRREAYDRPVELQQMGQFRMTSTGYCSRVQSVGYRECNISLLRSELLLIFCSDDGLERKIELASLACCTTIFCSVYSRSMGAVAAGWAKLSWCHERFDVCYEVSAMGQQDDDEIIMTEPCLGSQVHLSAE